MGAGADAACHGFTWYLKLLLPSEASDNIEDVLDVSTRNMQQLREEAGMVEADMLLRYIRIFQIVRSAEICSEVLLVALIKLCTPAMETVRFYSGSDPAAIGRKSWNRALYQVFRNDCLCEVVRHRRKALGTGTSKRITEDVQQVVRISDRLQMRRRGCLKITWKKRV